MVEGTIVVGVLARDCVNSLVRNIPRVEQLGSLFTDYKVVVYENDSQDGTTELVQRWSAENPNVTAICETILQKTIPGKSGDCPYPAKSVSRISKMVGFRNRVLDEVRAKYSPDYFMFIDIDIESFDPFSVVESIKRAPADWGALFANGHVYFANKDGGETPSSFQYDAYAFLPAGVDFRKTGDWVISKHFHDITAYTFDEKLSEVPFLPCSSAFNGMGIYRWQAIDGLQYSVEQTGELKRANACFCEHVPFNDAVRQRGFGLYVSREMEVVYFHKKETIVRRFTRWRQRLFVKFLLRFFGPYPVG